MKATIPQPDLLTTIDKVRSVVDKTDILPVMTCFKLTVLDGDLTVTASDTAITATASAPADVGRDGDALIKADTLYQFVKRIPADRSITLDSLNGKAKISAGRSRASLPTLPVEQFPVHKDVSGVASFTLSAEQVNHLLIRPSVAASSDNIRYYLCGVCLHAVGDELRGIATEGNFLIKHVDDLPDGCTLPENGIIIPSKAISTLAKAVGQAPVDIVASENAILFGLPGFTMTSRLIAGQFPDYQRVIPTERRLPVTFERGEALAVVERVTSVSLEESRAIRLSRDEGGIKVETAGSRGAESDDVIDAEISEDFGDIVLSRVAMTMIIGSMVGDRATIYFGKPYLVIDPDRPRDSRLMMPYRA